MSRSSPVVLLLLLLLPPVLGCAGSGEREAKPPNFVYVMFDDLGFGQIHRLQGNPHVRTPVLDRFAEESLFFDAFYASGSLCTPTRAAVLTGLYPLRFGYTWVIAGHGRTLHGLPTSAETLPEVLGRAGYSTAHFGKWHLGQLPPHTPREAGFEHSMFPLWPKVPNSYYDYRLVVDGVVDDPAPPAGHLTEALVSEAIRFLDAREGDPYYLNLWLFAPHKPYVSPPEWRRDFDGFCDDSPAAETCDEDFAALVAWADHQLGRLFEAVDRHDRRHGTETYLLVTSDNGPTQLDPLSTGGLKGKKLRVYEAGIRVPLLVRGPGIGGGATTSAVATTADLLPTLAELAGVEAPPVDGRSFARRLRGDAGPDAEERTLFWANKRPRGLRAWETLPQEKWDAWAVRRGDRKLVVDGRMELFDLAADPGERVNLCSSDECPEAADLGAAYRELRAAVAAVPLAPAEEQAVRRQPDGSFEFGARGYLSLGADPRLDTSTGGTDLTVLVEVNPGAVGDQAETVLARQPAWSLSLEPRAGGWQAVLRLSPPEATGLPDARLASSTLLPPGRWSRLAFTVYSRPFRIQRKPLPLVARLYVDGRPEADLRPFPTTRSAPGATLVSSPTRTFTGRLRSIRAYPLAWTPVEIGRLPPPPDPEAQTPPTAR